MTPNSLAFVLMVRICEAVQHAHQRGIIRKDLKPDNIPVDESRSVRSSGSLRRKPGPGLTAQLHSAANQRRRHVLEIDLDSELQITRLIQRVLLEALLRSRKCVKISGQRTTSISLRKSHVLENCQSRRLPRISIGNAVAGFAAARRSIQGLQSCRSPGWRRLTSVDYRIGGA